MLLSDDLPELEGALEGPLDTATAAAGNDGVDDAALIAPWAAFLRRFFIRSSRFFFAISSRLIVSVRFGTTEAV